MKLIIFDLETSGKNPQTASIIQIGAIKWVNGEIHAGNTFNIIIKPYTDIWEEEAETIHGISREILKKGYTIEKALESFENYIQNNSEFNLKDFQLAMWSCGWDTDCLQEAYKFINKSYPFNYRAFDISSYVRLSLYAREGKLPKKIGLGHLCKHLKIPIIRNEKHNALQDAEMTALILNKIIKRDDMLRKIFTNEK